MPFWRYNTLPYVVWSNRKKTTKHKCQAQRKPNRRLYYVASYQDLYINYSPVKLTILQLSQVVRKTSHDVIKFFF